MINGYFHTFESTGNKEIDDVLNAVTSACRAYHHTKDWEDMPALGENGWWDYIQNVANTAANNLKND